MGLRERTPKGPFFELLTMNRNQFAEVPITWLYFSTLLSVATHCQTSHLARIFSQLNNGIWLNARSVPGVFFYFNSTLNPILYSVMSKRFRRGFSDIKLNLFNRLVQLSSASSHSQHSDGTATRKLCSPHGKPRWGQQELFANFQQETLNLHCWNFDILVTELFSLWQASAKEEKETQISRLLFHLISYLRLIINSESPCGDINLNTVISNISFANVKDQCRLFLFIHYWKSKL